MNTNDHAIDIIVPIYDGFVEVKACLESIFASNFDQAIELVVIWDCGPDPKLYDYFLQLSQEKGFTFLENPKNVGFVQTVNRGMRLHPERDVLLLNSDTVVANNWLDRMLACAHSDSRIATVTPFSNNAEICSFPEICKANELPAEWTVPALDALFAQNVTPAAIDIPTAVGFCMFIRRSALVQLGDFDEATFARGYGEENDFCRRAAAQGYRNVHCSNVFVSHVGGVSFGTEKLTRVAHAMRILDERYPDYHGLVHEHIKSDPARSYRIQAALAMLRATEKPIVLILTHNLGGGTERYVADLQKYLSDKLQFLVVRPITDRILEMCLPWQGLRLYFDLTAGVQSLAKMCQQIGVSRLHIQHIMGMEASIKSLIDSLALPFDITLHDYFFING
ncbi:MAG: glycosyltransferase, partial [Pseudomonadales bacterium]